MPNSFPWQPKATTPLSDIACMNFGGDVYLYAEGFRQSAELLLEQIRTQGAPQDFLVYPIVYNLRHAIELHLKLVIRRARDLMDEPEDFPDSHRLDDLWEVCKPILKKIWPEDPSYEAVESVIKRICELDPVGESFRYPVTTKHKGRLPTLDRDLRRLDLGALVEDAVEVLDLLGGADAGIDHYLQSRPKE